MTTKIPLPTDTDLSEEDRQVLAGLPPLNVFRMMANAPASFRPLLSFASSILLESELDPRKREIAILRVAHVTRSKYEWTQHERLAKGLGLTDVQIQAIAVDGAVKGLDTEGNLLCRAADEISRDVRLGDDTLAAIVERYGVRQATELILCISYFNMLSRFLESTRVELEAEDYLSGRAPAELAKGMGRK